MTRGYSLEQDLRLLIDNKKYSNIEILCENEKKLHGSRAILATMSERFIIEILKNADYIKNYSPELLSKVLEIMLLSEDNIILKLLVDKVSIIPLDTIEFGVYRQIVKLNTLYLNGIREIPCKFKESDYVWDGSTLIIEDNGKVLQATSGCRHQNFRIKIPLDYKESLNGIYETWAGSQPTGRVLGTDGDFSNDKKRPKHYPSFRMDNTRITIHLNMFKTNLFF
ncbi:BTB/POZ protein [Rhizophagus clarus]|uniref:BTB/POZ protein n=1 Tax=Rhizophagus clarus TaxID=94130 RepID=A0A8H3MJ53_9GLOM|nr:BTB/POZ protein [Rhizophagus clarus]